MAQKVSRSDPSGTKTDLDVASLDQVKAGKVVIELADGSDAVLGTVEQVISGLVKDEVANLLRQKTIDLEYQGNETWATSTGTNNLSVLRGGVDAAAINAITDWAASYTIPSGTETEGALVVRLDKGENPNDYRLFNGIALNNVGDFNVPVFITSPTYDYYISPVSLIGRYATSETVVLQHHGTDPHTFFHGRVPTLESAITDVNADLGGKADSADLTALKTEVDDKQDARPFDALFEPNYYVKTNSEAITYHLYLHNIDTALLPNVNRSVARIKGQIVHNEAFNPATDTEQIVPLELSTVEVGNIRKNLGSDETIVVGLEFRHDSTVVFSERLIITVVDEPPFLTEAPDVSGFEQRYELVEVPSTATAISFGIEGQGGAPASLPGLSGTTYWVDYREVHGKLFRVQSGGSSNVNINLADLVEINNGGYRDALAGSVFLFQNDKSAGNLTFTGGGIADIRPTTAQGGASVTPGFAGICTLNPHATNRFALLVAAWNRAERGGLNQSQVDARIANYGSPFNAAAMARLLPTLPASGSRDNKIPKFNGNTLGWEEDAAAGFEVREVRAWNANGNPGHQELPTDFRDFDYVNFVMSFASLKRVSYFIPITALGNSSYIAESNGWGWTHSNRNITRRDNVDVFHYAALIKF